jgi:hypothetical protein
VPDGAIYFAQNIVNRGKDRLKKVDVEEEISLFKPLKEDFTVKSR